jgi:hypothetical protein
MNVTQHRSPGRRADLSPFGVVTSPETIRSAPRIRSAAGGELRNADPETDSGYGCVDWYHYGEEAADGPAKDGRTTLRGGRAAVASASMTSAPSVSSNRRFHER